MADLVSNERAGNPKKIERESSVRSASTHKIQWQPRAENKRIAVVEADWIT